MMIQARTGSGKTGAFLLPMLERLDPAQRHSQALILVPTRELARQVWQQADTMFAGSGVI
jgi:ATP-dependent RNA helicase DeaD